MEALRNLLGLQDGNILGKILIQLTPDLRNRNPGSRFEADGLAGGMDARLCARGAEELDLFSGHPAERTRQPSGNGAGRVFLSGLLPALITGSVIFQDQFDISHGICSPLIQSVCREAAVYIEGSVLVFSILYTV